MRLMSLAYDPTVLKEKLTFEVTRTEIPSFLWGMTNSYDELEHRER